MAEDVKPVSPETVRADFNDPVSVVHYARAAHFLGLWKSERLLIKRFFPDQKLRLLEAGCGAGRATLGLWQMGYHQVTAFDFAAEPLDQAKSLASLQAAGIQFHLADATKVKLQDVGNELFDGVCFFFNGLMQIPGRKRRRQALLHLRELCRPGAVFLFTTHDRDSSPLERAMWRAEKVRWASGTQDPKLIEFGDRYFSDAAGNTFMHLPDRAEILEDLAETGWEHKFDSLRRELATESTAVRDFSDECRFWVAERDLTAR
jgi:SAM-dependent methyltransferase